MLQEQCCIGTWNIRSMNQGKLDIGKQEMARVNIDILGISELNGQEWVNLIQMTTISTTVGKNPEVTCHSFLQWITFYQTSPTWSASIGWPHMALLSFIELDRAVVHVSRLTCFLWLWFQCVCPLMPSCSTYCLTWFSLILDMGYHFTAAPAEHRHGPFPWPWGSSSRLPPLTLDVG